MTLKGINQKKEIPMAKQILLLLRGLPGCGKSLLAGTNGMDVHSADDYFVGDDGVYNFDPAKLGEAHAQCQERTAASLKLGKSVTVANTFSCRWELEPYFGICADADKSGIPLATIMAGEGPGIKVFVVDMFDGGCSDEELFERNSHGVPLEGIQAMRERWEHDWRVGNPVPIWDRPLADR